MPENGYDLQHAALLRAEGRIDTAIKMPDLTGGEKVILETLKDFIPFFMQSSSDHKKVEIMWRAYKWQLGILSGVGLALIVDIAIRISQSHV